jgi:3-hydroxybutyryl-CoA dehydratase
MPNFPTIHDFNVGDRKSITRKITQELVASFADLIGDHDPIHTDPEYAKTTIYGRNIVHGVYLDCCISALLTAWPTGGVDCSFLVKYTAPVFVGDTLTITGTVREVKEERYRVYIDTVITNQDGVVVEKGEAVVKTEDGLK